MPKYHCNESNCHHFSLSPLQLDGHKRKCHYNLPAFECHFPGCDRTFNVFGNFKVHLKVHQKPSKLSCPFASCEKVYKRLSAFREHLAVCSHRFQAISRSHLSPALTVQDLAQDQSQQVSSSPELNSWPMRNSFSNPLPSAYPSSSSSPNFPQSTINPPFPGVKPELDSPAFLSSEIPCDYSPLDQHLQSHLTKENLDNHIISPPHNSLFFPQHVTFDFDHSGSIPPPLITEDIPLQEAACFCLWNEIESEEMLFQQSQFPMWRGPFLFEM